MLKEFVKIKEKEKDELFEQIRNLNKKRGSVRESVKKHTLWVDNTIKEYLLFYENFSKDITVAAVGGYGRSQLNPYSDIDIMLLYKNNGADENIVRGLYDLLYSLGYECSISTRGPSECIELAQQDDTIKTALYDSRFICGSKSIFKLYMTILENNIINNNKQAFIDSKLEYLKSRYSKYGNTVFILEPNIKEGVGSLRDYHTLLWISKTLNSTKNLLAMKKAGIINSEDYAKMRNSVYFLWQLRNALHFVTSKKTDILHLDLRNSVASEMGYEPSKRFSAQERLMRKYYYHARYIERITQKQIDIMINGSGKPKTTFFISKNISLSGSVIEYTKQEMGLLDVLSLLHFSALYDKHISTESMDKMRKVIASNIRKHKKDKVVCFMFRDMLSINKPLTQTVRTMHELGFLDKYIPEFGNICCLSEYSLYHKYTVDEHSIQAFSYLDALYDVDIPKTFLTRLSYIWKNLKPHDRFILRLAILLHDIGKIKKEKHEIVGSKLSYAISERLSIGKDLADKLHFLIKNHLLINKTISTRDIEDPKTLKDFVAVVDSKDKLNLLTLLSYADMKAVNDNVWNSWKESLIESLYLKTIYYFEDKNYDEFISANAKESKRRIKTTLNQNYKELIDEFPDNIFNDINTESMATYIKDIENTGRSVFIYETGKDTDKLLVYYKNEFGFFNKISGVLSCFNINIISAKSYNLKNGMIIDIFDVDMPEGSSISAQNIENMLNDIENGKEDLNSCILAKKSVFLSRTEKAKLELSLTQINVVVDNDLSDMYTVIRVYAPDRIGLVYDITKIFFKFKLHIGIFILDTKGTIAVDTFYVADEKNRKIYSDKLVNLIKSSLYGILSFEN